MKGRVVHGAPRIESRHAVSSQAKLTRHGSHYPGSIAQREATIGLRGHAPMRDSPAQHGGHYVHPDLTHKSDQVAIDDPTEGLGAHPGGVLDH